MRWSRSGSLTAYRGPAEGSATAVRPARGPPSSCGDRNSPSWEVVGQCAFLIGWFLRSTRAVTGGADLDDLSTRVLPSLEDATAGWRDLTAEWHSMLAGDAYQHLDPELIRASHRIRAVTNQLIGGPPGRADPAYALAFAIDVRQACPAIQDSLAHGSDLARSIRDTTNAAGSTIRGPARHLANRAVTLAGDDIAWVDPRALNRNHLITLPRPVREHIGAACDNIAVQTSQALAGSAILDRVRQPAATHTETPAPKPAVRRQPSRSHEAFPGTAPGAVIRHRRSGRQPPSRVDCLVRRPRPRPCSALPRLSPGALASIPIRAYFTSRL